MPHISLRISEREKSLLEGYAVLHGISISDAVKEAVFEKLEDEYDLNTIREYESNNKKVFYSLNEVSKELGLIQ